MANTESSVENILNSLTEAIQKKDYFKILSVARRNYWVLIKEMPELPDIIHRAEYYLVKRILMVLDIISYVLIGVLATVFLILRIVPVFPYNILLIGMLFLGLLYQCMSILNKKGVNAFLLKVIYLLTAPRTK